MLQILRRRYPLGTVCIYPALVQGDFAPRSIAYALETAGSDHCDIILMGRGGGSNEDLSAFQSEEVAAAVFRSPVPVISAVGHETDHCIADEVADLRAPTPSAAAELAVPDMNTLRASVQTISERLRRAFTAILDEKTQQLHDRRQILAQYAPDARLKLLTAELSAASERLHRSIDHLLLTQEQSLALVLSRLESVSPVAILQRGYALVYHEDTLVRDADKLKAGDTLTVQLAHGVLTAEVREIRKENQDDI